MDNPNSPRADSKNPVSRWIDWFMPENPADRVQVRERVLAGYVLLQAILGACTSIAMLLSDWPWESRWHAALITSGQSVVNLLLLFSLKRGMPRHYAVNGVVGFCYVTFTAAVIATGAPTPPTFRYCSSSSPVSPSAWAASAMASCGRS